MAVSVACVVDRSVSPADLAHLRCTDGSHAHLTWAQLRQYRDLGLIELNADGTIAWLRRPSAKGTNRSERVKGVVRLKRQIGIRGLSCKVGGTLAVAVEKREEDWPRVMLGDIRRDHSAPPPDPRQA